MLQVKRMVGDTEVMFTSDSKDLKEDIVRCSWLLNAPDKCGACGSANISLQGRVTANGEYTYVEFICKDCFAKTAMGEYKAPKGALFVKNKKENWQVWKKEEASE